MLYLAFGFWKKYVLALLIDFCSYFRTGEGARRLVEILIETTLDTGYKIPDNLYHPIFNDTATLGAIFIKKHLRDKHMATGRNARA